MSCKLVDSDLSPQALNNDLTFSGGACRGAVPPSYQGIKKIMLLILLLPTEQIKLFCNDTFSGNFLQRIKLIYKLCIHLILWSLLTLFNEYNGLISSAQHSIIYGDSRIQVYLSSSDLIR